MPSFVVSSWGNAIHGEHAVYSLYTRFDPFPTIELASSVLAFGNGRSYGDSCLNIGGALLQMRALDRFIHFDSGSGILACEAGVLLKDILCLIVPAGWFLQVVPGTQYVTVGGAIANDVHGKNHHRAGTFGCHVRRFELLRSTGKRVMCSRNENSEWFEASIGGLGLTGIITWVELQLRPIAGPWLDVESLRFSNVNEFFQLSAESDQSFEYTVSWIDCLARGNQLGRGILYRANHSGAGPAVPGRRDARWSVPLTPPKSLVNAISLRVFNTVHYRLALACRRRLEHFQTFFFPLDGIRNWNLLYGRRGFYQYQCVIPIGSARDSTVDLLKVIARSRLGSFLAVLKHFGPVDSPGMLSFPMEGVTLALDFPNSGARTAKLFAELDKIVSEVGGRLYPAKDARMPKDLFQNGYPLWKQFAAFIDPCCSSTFWRRIAH